MDSKESPSLLLMQTRHPLNPFFSTMIVKQKKCLQINQVKANCTIRLFFIKQTTKTKRFSWTFRGLRMEQSLACAVFRLLLHRVQIEKNLGFRVKYALKVLKMLWIEDQYRLKIHKVLTKKVKWMLLKMLANINLDLKVLKKRTVFCFKILRT